MAAPRKCPDELRERSRPASPTSAAPPGAHRAGPRSARSLDALKQTPPAIAPSTYHAAKSRPESARATRDRELLEKIEQVHDDNYGVHGARKLWAELNRHGVDVARYTAERLMREIGHPGCETRS